MACPVGRTYPMQKPEGWKPKYPRYMLQLPEHVQDVAIAYIGVQSAPQNDMAHFDAVQKIKSWSETDADAPLLAEKFEVVEGYDVPGSVVWLFYWINPALMKRSIARLQLANLYESLGDAKASVGMWCEQFAVPTPRFETIYSGTDYKPGMASLPGAEQLPHEMTGYWGAARDRFPASAHDLFQQRHDAAAPDFGRPSRGSHLAGCNEDVLVHIRSGQFWENCPPEERDAYEQKLQPVLRKGMKYLEENPDESGDFGLRILRNLPRDGSVQDRPRRETCTAGFYRSLKDLEYWASSHPTHKAIFKGVHDHSTAFGKTTFKLRTWHEVCIVEPGEAEFEYINCDPITGVIPFQELPVAEPN